MLDRNTIIMWPLTLLMFELFLFPGVSLPGVKLTSLGPNNWCPRPLPTHRKKALMLPACHLLLPQTDSGHADQETPALRSTGGLGGRLWVITASGNPFLPVRIRWSHAYPCSSSSSWIRFRSLRHTCIQSPRGCSHTGHGRRGRERFGIRRCLSANSKRQRVSNRTAFTLVAMWERGTVLQGAPQQGAHHWPVQFLSSESRAKPLSHLHLKLPMVFLHLPWVQRLGIILHSLISSRKRKCAESSWASCKEFSRPLF